MTNIENITTTNSSSSLSTNQNSINLSTEIEVITLEDNLTHPYFSFISWSKDSYTTNPGTAKMVMPYIQEMLEYWRKYSGVVIISADLKQTENSLSVNTLGDSFDSEQSTTQNYQSIETLTTPQERVDREKLGYEPIKYDDDAKRNSSAPYNYSFIGKVMRVKIVGQELHILINDLGWKFSQKVPREFRDSYICNQTLDNAFQAICEFMGIEFAYSIEHLNELEFAEDGYSVKKDGEIIEDVPSLFREWSTKTDEDDGLDDPQNESSGLVIYNEQQKRTDLSSTTNSDETTLAYSKISEEDTSSKSEDENNEEEETDTSLSDKIEKYQAEFDEKIKNLFIGNMMYNSDLTSNVMDYGAITITPTASSSNNISSIGTSSNSDSSSDSNSEPQLSTINKEVAQSSIGLKGISIIKKKNNLLGI